jgi:signal transduction histidine kinase
VSGIERHIRSDPAGTPAIVAKPVPFPDLLPEIRRFYWTMAKRKGLEFAVEIDADVPPAIVTDRLRLQELLSTLLGNAFEFIREGGVTLRIRRARGGAPEATVIAFDIVDTGVERGCDGSLPIARDAALLGGLLACSRTPGEGSTFSLYLPLVTRP